MVYSYLIIIVHAFELHILLDQLPAAAGVHDYKFVKFSMK